MAVYSHSKISTFEQCPLKYKFRYIDNLIPDIPQSIEGFLGNKVHDALEWIYKEASKGRILELDEVIKYYIEKWNQDYKKEIKIVKEDLDAEYYFNLGIKFLIDYFLAHSPFHDNTIAIEKLIEVNLDSEGKYKVQGYIDRLVFNKENNTFEIHDYKTSNVLKTQEELDKDRQLALYSIAVRESFNANDVDLVWHFLAFNKKLTSKRTLEELEKLKKEIIYLIDKIELTKEFSPNPGCLCKWCEFQSYCKVNKNYVCQNESPDYND